MPHGNGNMDLRYIRLRPSCWHHLQETVRSLKGDDPLTPVTVVAPTTYSGLFLRHALGRDGLANVRFVVLPRLTELLGAAALDAQGKRPLTSVLESAIVRSVAADASGALARLRGHPSLHQSLQATFRDLRLASAVTMSRLEDRGGLVSEVLRLFRIFRLRSDGYYDREDLARSAAEAISSDRASALDDLGAIVFYLPRSLTPGEREMVFALAQRGRALVMLPATGDEEVDSGARALADAILPVSETPEIPNDDGELQSTELLIAGDAREEVRSVSRRIARDLESGIPMYRIAVLYPHGEPYSGLIRQELERAGISIYGPAGTSIANSAAGRTLMGLLDLADGSFAREQVMAWLTSSPIAPAIGGGAWLPSHWDTISKLAGVVAGVDQWEMRLEAFALALERQVDQAPPGEELAEVQAVRRRTEAKSSRELAAFIKVLAQRVQPPPESSSWKEFSNWARGLLDHYVDRSMAPPLLEAEALRKAETGLEEIAAVDSIAPGGTTMAQFRRAVDDVVSSPVGHLGRYGHGVFVGPFGAAQAMEFDRLYLVGMIEGAVPPRAQDDPLVPDRDRVDASSAPGAMPLRTQRRDEVRYAFLGAMATSWHRTLSYPKSLSGSRRTAYPSRWFLEEASVLHGDPVYSADLEGLADSSWLTVVPSAEAGLRAADHVAFSDSGDYDLHCLQRWRDAGRDLAMHHVAGLGHIAHAIQMERERETATLTPFDGDLSSVAPSIPRLRISDGAPLSPTRLQDFATCPYRYFLRHVLRLSAIDKPEEIITISALDRGSIIHGVLHEFMAQVGAAGRMPRPAKPWDDGHRALLNTIAERALRGAEERGVTGKELLWELERVAILEDLEEFLLADEALRSRFGGMPHAFELGFGRGQGAQGDAQPVASLSLPGLGPVQFRGAIDRLDLNEDGRVALVLDYKTGATTRYRVMDDDVVDRGRLLQLPVYALAVQSLLGDQVDRVEAAYWFVSARGGFSTAPSAPIALQDMLAPFQRSVDTCARGIQEGLFPLNPGDESNRSWRNCGYCEFDSLCPTRRDQHWERKQKDPRLQDYARLASGVDSDTAGQAS